MESRTVKKSRIRELYERYVDAMESWQIKLAIARIRDFRIPPDSWDDTMQELAIVVHEFQFDPAKANGASEETILCRFFDHRIKMLARSNARHLALRNRIGRMSQEVVDTCLPEDRLIQEEVLATVKLFPPFKRRICRALMKGQSAYQIAQSTGRHYETIRRHVAQIREAFDDRGYC